MESFGGQNESRPNLEQEVSELKASVSSLLARVADLQSAIAGTRRTEGHVSGAAVIAEPLPLVTDHFERIVRENNFSQEELSAIVGMSPESIAQSETAQARLLRAHLTILDVEMEKERKHMPSIASSMSNVGKALFSQMKDFKLTEDEQYKIVDTWAATINSTTKGVARVMVPVIGGRFENLEMTGPAESTAGKAVSEIITWGVRNPERNILRKAEVKVA